MQIRAFLQIRLTVQPSGTSKLLARSGTALAVANVQAVSLFHGNIVSSRIRIAGRGSMLGTESIAESIPAAALTTIASIASDWSR